MPLRFAAFIITYNRELLLCETISVLLRQSIVPQKILILDNGNLPADYIVEKLMREHRVSYHCMGFNAGPAGAAAVGLRMLAAEGFEWVYWGDDNDPPIFLDTFERMFKSNLNDRHSQYELLGTVGHRFNRLSGSIIRTPDGAINTSGLLEVDSIAGNQSMLVHRSVVEAGVLPDPKLFFGFEELDFCLSVKAAGFRIGVDKSLFLRCRQHFNRMGLKETGPYKYPESALWRQYYSTRNLLLIFRKHGLWSAWVFHLIRSSVKLFYNFRHGWVYGRKSWRMVSAGLVDGLLGRSGFRQW